MTDHVDFDKAKVKRLRTAYNKAKQAGLKSFIFEGNEYDTKYAYYLIQYLDEHFKD